MAQQALAGFVSGALVFYCIGWFVTLRRDRPPVVRHPLTGQWTAARSIVITNRPPLTVTLQRSRHGWPTAEVPRGSRPDADPTPPEAA